MIKNECSVRTWLTVEKEPSPRIRPNLKSSGRFLCCSWGCRACVCETGASMPLTASSFFGCPVTAEREVQARTKVWTRAASCWETDRKRENVRPASLANRNFRNSAADELTGAGSVLVFVCVVTGVTLFRKEQGAASWSNRSLSLFLLVKYCCLLHETSSYLYLKITLGSRPSVI